MRKKRLYIFGLLFLIVGIVLMGTFLLDTAEGLARIKKEDECVAHFLKKAEAVETIPKTESDEQGDSVSQEVKDTEEKDENWTDDAYYERDGTIYTPEYASGYLECVLEIPSIRLRRGVYSGSWEEIRKNLDIWMVTAARPDYELGNTVYCIYGHNHPIQNLSFNRLEQLAVGDRFTLTSQTSILEYEVTAVYGKTREQTTTEIVDNFSLSPQDCYLITCGRGNYRYLDFIVQGTLVRRSALL